MNAYEQHVRAGLDSGSVDIYALDTTDGSEPQVFVGTDADEYGAQFSPDGNLVAYVSNETGRPQVFVAVFPQPGARWQVSQSGGTQPRWSRNGHELFYHDPENFILSVAVEETSTSGFRTGAERRLFQFHGSGADWCYDVAPDGERFLVTTPLEEDLTSPVTFITDWTRKMASR